MGKDDFVWSGRRIIRKSDRVDIHQAQSNEAIEITRPSAERRAQLHSPLEGTEISEIKSCNGSLQWVGGQTRPELSGMTSLLQGGDPTVETLLQSQSLLKEVRDSPHEGMVIYPCDLNNTIVMAFGDSSWANAMNHKTQAALMIYLGPPSCLTPI